MCRVGGTMCVFIFLTLLAASCTKQESALNGVMERHFILDASISQDRSQLPSLDEIKDYLEEELNLTSEDIGPSNGVRITFSTIGVISRPKIIAVEMPANSWLDKPSERKAKYETFKQELQESLEQWYATPSDQGATFIHCSVAHVALSIVQYSQANNSKIVVFTDGLEANETFRFWEYREKLDEFQ